MKRTLALLVCIIPLASTGAPGDALDAVDWVRGTIVASARSSARVGDQGSPLDETGEPVTITRARMNAYDTARESALQKMTQQIGRIRVDGETMLTDLIEQNEDTRQRLDAILRTRVRTRSFPAGHRGSGCTLTLKISSLVPALAMMYPKRRFPVQAEVPLSTDYTGLIVDARGIGVEPMILPSIFNEDGLEIYGRQYVDIRHLADQGIVAYARNEAEAMKNPRAGAHPYFTVALRSVKGGPVLSRRDMRKILAAKATRDNLRRCRVIFIIDRKSALQ